MFPCDKCGICCRNIGEIELLHEFDDGTGVCKHLKDNLCSIYDSRPDICNVDLMYDKFFHNFYNKEEYYKLNIEGCRRIKGCKKI